MSRIDVANPLELGNTIRVSRGQLRSDEIFGVEPAEDLLPADPVVSEIDRLRRLSVDLGWRELAEGAVRPGCIVADQVFGQYLSQVMLVDDQQPVQKFAAQRANILMPPQRARHRKSW